MKELWVITGSGLWVDRERLDGVWPSSSYWLRGWWMTGGKTEQRGKWLENIQRELFFSCWWGRILCRYVTHLHFFFQSCQRAWEPVWPTAGQARRESDGRQGFFPSYILLQCSQYYKYIYIWCRTSDLIKGLYRWLLFSCVVLFFFILLGFAFDDKVLFGFF